MISEIINAAEIERMPKTIETLSQTISGFKTFNQVQSQGGPRDSTA